MTADRAYERQDIVAFDHRDDGTPAEAWSTLLGALPAGAAVGPHDHLVVLAAHPDDETLGAGGLIHDAGVAGAHVTVIVATDGEGSHPGSPTHDPGRLAQLRRSEVEAAVARLAPQARLVTLGRPDGRLADEADGLYDDVAAAVADATMIASTWRGDGHPDHEVCGTVAARLAADIGARLVEFPIWGLHWGRPGGTGPLLGDGWVTRQLSDGARTAKAAALAEYRSQVSALSSREGDEAVLGPGMLAHFARPLEVFRAAAQADLPPGYFDRLYADDPDPWRTGERFYEQRKRALVLAALPRPRFATAFEPGCGTGALTAALAARCDHVLAMDASAHAAGTAADRTATDRNVEVRTGAVPEQWPDGCFDLIVVSEIGYYLADPAELAARARAALTDDGVLVACHWRHPAPGYPTSAQQVHEALGRDLREVAHHVETDFVLDVWSRTGRSVAEWEGLVEDGSAGRC